jgi:hypothetical protein
VNRASGRPPAHRQGALRAHQGLDPIDVEELEIRVQRRLAKVHSNSTAAGRIVARAVDAVGIQAAHDDRGIAPGTRVDQIEARHESGHLVQRLHAKLLRSLAAHGRNADGCILYAGAAPCGCHDDLFELGRRVVCKYIGCRPDGENGRNRGRDRFLPQVHRHSPRKMSGAVARGVSRALSPAMYVGRSRPRCKICAPQQTRRVSVQGIRVV